MADDEKTSNPIAFKAETQQLLNILINSLYSDRDVFLREIISNASDAITRLNFEMLTNHNVLDSEAETSIHVTCDKEKKTLLISDNGIGMNEEEIKEYLGTIAHSGARDLLKAAEGQDGNHANITDLIGQFGVGFYAAFMVADEIEVTSRSFRPEDSAVKWTSVGTGTFTVEPSDKATRGTDVLIKLKKDAEEYSEEYKIRDIIKKHSNYIPYPIFLGDGKEQVNAANVIWRMSPTEVKDEDYKNFYQSFTMDFQEPMNRMHLSIDAPVQMYALLFIPSSAERNMFSLRKEDGLQLYARKVLIQDYCTDLLPRYYRFIQGVIDSEDIPLNVSRETMQANRVIQSLKKILTGKVTDFLEKWMKDDPEKYTKFWEAFGIYLCEGVITDPDAKDVVLPLLRFQTMNHGTDFRSLSDYVQEMKPDQKKIYYVLGDNLETLRNSPHSESLRKDGIDVLLLTKEYDPLVVTTIGKYQDFDLVNVASDKAEEPKAEDADSEDKDKEKDKESEKPEEEKLEYKPLVELFKSVLGDKVSNVKTTDRLVSSPARLVEGEGALPQEMQRVYRVIQQSYSAPKKVLEVNPDHPLIQKVVESTDESLRNEIIGQVFDDALLMDGETPDQVAMLTRIQNMMMRLLEK